MTIRDSVNEWGLIISSHSPFISLGVAITPGNNTYGTYAQIIAGSAVTDDVWGLWININGNAVSGVARDSIAKIGVDPTGGTSYTDMIVDLACSCAGAISALQGGGIWYYFPLSIKAGSSIGCAVSVNNATVGTCNALCQLFCRPRGPIMPRVGSFVRTFGSTLASSSGTAITPNGAGAKSAYIQLGSATVETLWYWQIGVCINNATMSNAGAAWDLSLGTSVNKVPVIVDQMVLMSATENVSYTSQGAEVFSAAGDLVFVRAGSGNTAPTGISAIAYGVGG